MLGKSLQVEILTDYVLNQWQPGSNVTLCEVPFFLENLWCVCRLPDLWEMYV